jgi:RNA polymerase sigma factor (TIGR02999 family)
MSAIHQSMVSSLPSAVSAARGESASIESLYGRLRRICGRRMLAERVGHTLQGTALAHEVFLRIRFDEATGNGRGNLPVRWFFAAASTAIRQVVVDHARARSRMKRGGGWKRTSCELLSDGGDICARRDAILLADELLADLASVSPVQAQIAQLRFFCGLSFVQIAEVVGLAEYEVRREWRLAQVWLGSRPAAEGWSP